MPGLQAGQTKQTFDSTSKESQRSATAAGCKTIAPGSWPYAAWSHLKPGGGMPGGGIPGLQSNITHELFHEGNTTMTTCPASSAADIRALRQQLCISIVSRPDPDLKPGGGIPGGGIPGLQGDKRQQT